MDLVEESIKNCLFPWDKGTAFWGYVQVFVYFVSKTAGETPATTVWHIWTFMAAFTASAIEGMGR